MAYKYSIGSQVIGDLKGSEDAQGDTQIDFGEDQIQFQTSGSVRLEIANHHISSSLPISASLIDIQEGISITGQNVLDNEANLSVGSITLVDQTGPLYQMPSGDGNPDEVMTTDGTGQIQFRPVSELGAASFLHYGYNPSFQNSTPIETRTINGSTNDYGYRMPLSGVITHLTCQLQFNASNGSTYEFIGGVYKNNSLVGSGSMSITKAGGGGGSTGFVKTFDPPISFDPNETITVKVNFDQSGISGDDLAALIRVVTTV